MVSSNSSPIVYTINPLPISIAYAYTTRQLSVSPLSSLTIDNPDIQEARHSMARLTPFLTAKNSKVLHSSLSSVITDIWSRFRSVSSFCSLLRLLQLMAPLGRGRWKNDGSPLA